MARLNFTKKHLSQNSKDWSKTFWSDEQKYLLFGNDGKCNLRRPNRQKFDPKYQLDTNSKAWWRKLHGVGLLQL